MTWYWHQRYVCDLCNKEFNPDSGWDKDIHGKCEGRLVLYVERRERK